MVATSTDPPDEGRAVSQGAEVQGIDTRVADLERSTRMLRRRGRRAGQGLRSLASNLTKAVKQ